MDSTALTPAQLAKLLKGIERHRDYFVRLRHRISVSNFPDSDALKTATIHAYDAIEQLHSVAAELERIASLQMWAGGQKQPEIQPRDRRARRD